MNNRNSWGVSGRPDVIDKTVELAPSFPGIIAVERTSPESCRITHAEGYHYPEVAQPIADAVQEWINTQRSPA